MLDLGVLKIATWIKLPKQFILLNSRFTAKVSGNEIKAGGKVRRLCLEGGAWSAWSALICTVIIDRL